jgi:hypothetical protein
MKKLTKRAKYLVSLILALASLMSWTESRAISRDPESHLHSPPPSPFRLFFV